MKISRPERLHDILLLQLVPILRRFDMVQLVKLRKIGKNPKNFRKNSVFEANKFAQAENFRNLLTWSERAFSCGSVFKILNCLGEIGLEKNSRNFYKCRGMTRFGEKKTNANNKAPRFARRLKKKSHNYSQRFSTKSAD